MHNEIPFGMLFSMAQLYLKKVPVLINRSYGQRTERDVFNALADFAKAKTVIMVTHREAGLGLVDVVYGMEWGRFV